MPRKLMLCLVLFWIAVWQMPTQKLMMIGPWDTQVECQMFVSWFEGQSDLAGGACYKDTTKFTSF